MNLRALKFIMLLADTHILVAPLNYLTQPPA
jgi:hypothetical protein